MKRGVQTGILVALVMAVVLGAAALWRPNMIASGFGPLEATTRVVPAGVRIRVEVLNASTVRGLARRATMYLRDRGFDVVENGSTTDLRDSTLIVDHSAHPGWGTLAAKAMGGAKVESRPDTLRDVDLTVLVGATWRPPAEPFYP
jgi:hypothetical protein